MKPARGVVRTIAIAIAGACALTSSSVARADDDAAAVALFDEGKKLLAEGRYAEACPKLEESQRLSPGIGTKYNLADCYEKTGRIASAWGAFLDVAAQTRAKGQTEREQAARERAAALERRLPRLMIHARVQAEGLAILRDGAPVREAALDVAVPVDPGEHVIEATAPKKKRWRRTVMAAEGVTHEITIDALIPTDEPGDAPKLVGGADEPRRMAGAGMMAAGVVGLGLGTYFGVRAIQKHGDAADHCSGDACDAAGVSLRQDAVAAGNASTIAYLAGGALLAVGAYVYFTTSSAKAAPAVSIGVSPTAGAIRLRF